MDYAWAFKNAENALSKATPEESNSTGVVGWKKGDALHPTPLPFGADC